MPQFPDLVGMFKHIEKAARNCYRSEDKITDDSYIRMIDMLIGRKHYSPMEHGTIYLSVSKESSDFNNIATFYKYNHYSKSVFSIHTNTVYVTTNYRVILENDRTDDLKYMCEPTVNHVKRYTFKVVMSIGTSREFNRHRAFSISESSTRYCNFSKDKFGSTITGCRPSWMNTADIPKLDAYYIAVNKCEAQYMKLLDLGATPQEARGVLPLDTATTVFYTAFDDD